MAGCITPLISPDGSAIAPSVVGKGPLTQHDGTPLAYHPPGSLVGASDPDKLVKDYQAWSPDEA